MKLQQLLSYTRKAIDDYQMIEPGDKIAIGVSGGKDSLTLLYALSGLKQFYPKPFTLEAITVNLGLEGMDFTPVKQLCKELDIPYTIVSSHIAEIIFEQRKEKNPCSLCAKMRKGALNEKAQALGCNKVAYAHHKDDFIETMLLSLLFEGRFYAFSPKIYLDRTKLMVIRPFFYIDEINIKSFQHNFYLPIVKNRCIADGNTKREYAKNLLAQLNQEHPGARERMFHAIQNGNISGWPKQ